ncbi:hypothetical protein HPP92_022310 [Vanilla planifolia]|uniref:Uncharacterized protein n=1 Tax=Vanilla planifolia TaxID=51239 RepID=A0A835PQP4_VANPL|nr:hypothetical protein HPP92_022310 [Vanilla planifolia]
MLIDLNVHHEGESFPELGNSLPETSFSPIPASFTSTKIVCDERADSADSYQDRKLGSNSTMHNNSTEYIANSKELGLLVKFQQTLGTF